jgi:hypothetical protein
VFTFKIVEALKHVYESIGEGGSLSSLAIISQITGHEKKLAPKYLQNESSYTLLRNRRVCGRHYFKTKACFPLQILQVDLLTLDETRRRHNQSNKCILLVISVFSRDAYAILLRSKRGDKVARALEIILEQDSHKKIQRDRGSEFANPHVKKVLLKYNTDLYHSHSPIKATLAERLIKTV